MNQEILIHDLIVQEKRKYFKNWRLKNKDKVRKNNQKYWQKRAQKILSLKGSDENG